MDQQREVVITGMGVVSPIGIGCDAFWQSLREGRSGVKPIPDYQNSELIWKYGGYIADFEPKQYVTPRKSLKVMSREIQTACAASTLAATDAGIAAGTIDPDRIGVIFGSEMLYADISELAAAFRECLKTGEMDFDRWGEAAMREVYPLWMLKYLPNMAACHVAIAFDARGPNNTLTMDETSSLAAVAEAVHVIQRGHADVILTGGTGSRINPTRVGFAGYEHLSRFEHDPRTESRPFDARRDGIVHGEGAATIVLESRQHAESRGARIWGRILGEGNSYEAPRRIRQPGPGRAIGRAIEQSLRDAGLQAADIGHVNAHGAGSKDDDIIEARAIRETLGDVPVTAMKSYFGHLGAGGGAVELVGTVLALHHREVPRTLNYEHPDPDCPVNVVRGETLACDKPFAMKLNQSTMGHAVAIVVAR